MALKYYHPCGWKKHKNHLNGYFWATWFRKWSQRPRISLVNESVLNPIGGLFLLEPLHPLHPREWVPRIPSPRYYGIHLCFGVYTLYSKALSQVTVCIYTEFEPPPISCTQNLKLPTRTWHSQDLTTQWSSQEAMILHTKHSNSIFQ